MKKRTLLKITKAVREFAKENGAYFDKTDGNWYVENEVPSELEDFIDKEKRRRDYFSEQVEQCRLCGCQMQLITHPSEPFWRCSSSHCKGGKVFELHGELKSPIEIIFNPKIREAENSHQKNGAPPEIKERAIEIIEKAIKLFNNREMAKQWLESPKIALKQKSPITTMIDLNGCDRVEKLLLERFE